MKTPARAMLPLLFILLSACGRPGEPAPRSELAGVWDLHTVDGATLPAPSPEEPAVILHSVTLTLGDGGDFALRSAFRMQGQSSDSEAPAGGTWQATDRALTFYNDDGGPAVVEFGYRVDGDMLQLTDHLGHVWVMRRR